MISHYRTALGAIVEVDSANGQNVPDGWTTISEAEFTAGMAAYAAVRPAARAAAAAAEAADTATRADAYAALVRLGLSAEQASVIAGHNPKDQP